MRPGVAHHSGIDVMFALPAPRQQLAQAVDRMSADHPGKHILQVGVRFDAVELAGLDEGAEHR